MAPEQRILPAFADNHHDWPLMEPPRSELAFAQWDAGCQVRMLFHNDASAFPKGLSRACTTSPDEADVSSPTSHSWGSWRSTTSQCASCQSLLFDIVHLAGNPATITQNTSSTHYDSAVLQDVEDWSDRALFICGSDIFAQTLLGYDVTVASCQPCFEADFL